MQRLEFLTCGVEIVRGWGVCDPGSAFGILDMGTFRPYRPLYNLCKAIPSHISAHIEIKYAQRLGFLIPAPQESLKSSRGPETCGVL